jgi:aquaporin Z
VNPARSTGPAIIAATAGGSWALTQLWLFWLAPLLGGAAAGIFYEVALAEHEVPPVKEDPVVYSAAN